MSDEIELKKIQENIRKRKELEERLGSGESYMVNMTNLSDTDDSDDSNPVDENCEALKQTTGKLGAVAALTKTILKTCGAGEELNFTINAEFKKLKILCSKDHHKAFKSADELNANVSGLRYRCQIDELLQAGPYFPMLELEQSLKNTLIECKRVASNIGKGPGFDATLAWICYAGQCTQFDLLPPGEVFSGVEQFSRHRLQIFKCSPVEDVHRVELARFQILRIFEILALCDLSSHTPTERSLLLFAVCRIVLDRHVGANIQSAAVQLMTNIINASSINQRKVITEFAKLFPLLSDDYIALRMVLECFRLADIPPYTCLCLTSELFVSISERAECEPEYNDSMNDDDFIDTCLKAIIETFDDAMQVFARVRKNQSALLNMLDTSLTSVLFPLNLPDVTERRMTDICGVLTPFERNLVANNGSADDTVLESQLRTMSSRLKIIDRMNCDRNLS